MVNIGTTFAKIVKRAKLAAWPKAIQNLRATRETELMAKYPTKDVASWLGNSAPVAMKHYAMATAESFDRAIEPGARDASNLVRPKLRHSTPIDEITEQSEYAIDGGDDEENPVRHGSGQTVTKGKAARLGLEPRITESESVVLPITLSGRIAIA